MGQSSSKHGQQVVGVGVLMSNVCNVAEKLAAAKCGKHSVMVFKQAAALRDMLHHWESSQGEAEELQGCQVFAMAAALQALSTRLEWCHRKLQQHPLISVTTSRQTAAQVLRVLGIAQEAYHNFNTAFKLAIMISRQQVLVPVQAAQQQQQDLLLPLKQQEPEQGRHSGAASDSKPGSQPGGATPPWQAGAQQHRGTHEGLESDHPASQQGAPDASIGQAQPSCAPTNPITSPKVSSTDSITHTAALNATAEPPTPGEQTAATDPGAAALSPAVAPTPPTPAAPAAPAADECDDAQEGLSEWDHSQEGWQGLLQRARHGDVEAVLACAQELIHGGDFCLQDISLARQLLRTAVYQSGGTACLWLGQLAERGLGLPAGAPDYVEAAAWYGKGAALGHLACAQALAFYYQHGLGLAQDAQAALEWYEFAADGGLAAAQNNLGQLLLTGAVGIAADAAAAVQLFQAAADQGSAAAWFNLGVCHEQGLLEHGPDLAAAEACYQQAGTAKALLRLGHLCLQQHNNTAAREAFTAAAEAGSGEALMQLAKMQSSQPQLLPASSTQQRGAGATLLPCLGSSLQGLTGVRDISNGQGPDCSCVDATGVRHGSSLAGQASADVALQLYQQAAEAGVAEAQHAVGCFCWGQGRAADALQAWHAAAAQGYGPALLSLAAAADNGLQGVCRDRTAARACYAMAAACGSADGAGQLELLNQEEALHSNSWLTLQAPWKHCKAQACA